MRDRCRIVGASILVIILAAGLVAAVRLVGHPPSLAPPTPEMVLILDGTFTMGSDSDDPDARPPHQVDLAAFTIARREVTNAQYAAFLNATRGTSSRCGGHVCVDTQLDSPRCRIRSRQGRYVPERGYEHHPVTCVSWYGAQAYCQRLNMRLPTEPEWEKAARGTSGRTYPWGDVVDPARLNASNRVGDTTPVGSYPGGASPYGLLDMAGNVWEWTADWYEAYPGSTFDSAMFGQKVKVVRGGSWNHPHSDARTAHRDLAHPARRIHVVGFRCARDVE